MSVGESFTVALNLGIENVWIRVGECQDFLSKSLCLTVRKVFVGESFAIALFSKSEKEWIGWGRVSRFSVGNFMSHSAENARKGVLYCCINFGYRKSLEKRAGEYQDFPSKTLCLTKPKNSVVESFTVAFFPDTDRVLIGGGREEYQDFLSKTLCLTVRKIFVGESFTVAIISGTEKVWRRGG